MCQPKQVRLATEGPASTGRLNVALTPPTTPESAQDLEKRRVSLLLDSARLVERPSTKSSGMQSTEVGLGVDTKLVAGGTTENRAAMGPMRSVPQLSRQYHGFYQLRNELGYGAWSTVYSVSEVPVPSGSSSHSSAPLTPPGTPEQSRRSSAAQLLAVKALARQDGKSVLEKEARILTYLHSHSEAAKYLVPFHGLNSTQRSIVMDLVPLTLESHAREMAKAPLTTESMFQPVMGGEQWQGLAKALIAGLAFLHAKRCIHGDIKPANILLQQGRDCSGRNILTPLYCDFSSSHVLDEPAASGTVDLVSAVTTEYAAPELLRALRSGSTERPVATFASDVFSLGTTLLFAALGESPYAMARISFQKLEMAKEGRPLDYARSGSQGTRVQKGQVVDRILEAAVVKEAKKRTDVETWKVLVERVTRPEDN